MKEKTIVEKSMFHMLILMFNELVNVVKLGCHIIVRDLLSSEMVDTLNQDGFKTIRILDPPNTPIIPEQSCQPNADGDCIVMGDKFIDYSTEYITQG